MNAAGLCGILAGIVLRLTSARVASHALAIVIGGMPGPSRAQDPADASDYAFVQKPGAAVSGDLAFREADGRGVRLAEVGAGRPLVLALGYFHCPSLCSVVRDDLLTALSRSGKQAGTDYDLAVVSIDPAESPAEAAAAKAEDRDHTPVPGDAAALHYLTGEAGAVAALEGAVGFTSRYDVPLRQFLHPAGIVVLTPDRRVSGYVLGVGYRPGDLAAALTRAGSGVIARAALPILLVCFHFDAATGRYTLEVLKVLRLGAAITVMALVAGVVVLRRKDRRGRAA